MKLTSAEISTWKNKMVDYEVTKSGGVIEKALGGASISDVLSMNLEHGDKYGHDESGRMVVYNGSHWENNQPWLDAIFRCGLGDQWSETNQKRAVGYIVGSTDEIPAVVGNLLNFQNTLIDWKTGVTCAHSPDLVGTVQFGCDLAIGAGDADRPNWHAYLNKCVPTDAHDVLQEWLGYLLMWGNPYRKAAMMHGPTGSGKSVFQDVVVEILGQRNVSSANLQTLSGNRFAVADLFGMVANLCGDIDADEIKRSGQFKLITSGDPIRAERKNEKPFTFRPRSKLMFSANTVPKSTDKTNAWLDRWLMLPFPNGTTGEERVEGYTDAILAETHAIAWWAFEGLQRLMGRGHFDESLSVAEAKHTYREENDDVLRFLNEQYEIVTSGSVKGGVLWDHFVMWHACNHMGQQPDMSSSDFYVRVRGAWKVREPKIAGNAVYFGVKQKESVAVW